MARRVRRSRPAVGPMSLCFWGSGSVRKHWRMAAADTAKRLWKKGEIIEENWKKMLCFFIFFSILLLRKNLCSTDYRNFESTWQREVTLNHLQWRVVWRQARSPVMTGKWVALLLQAYSKLQAFSQDTQQQVGCNDKIPLLGWWLYLGIRKYLIKINK